MNRPKTSMLTALLSGVALALFFWFIFTAVAHAQIANGINYNATTPAAPAGARNVQWQNDSSRPIVNASAYVTYPTVQVACPAGSDLSAAVNACLASLPATQGGICDARACSANFTWNTATTISQANSAVLLPCGTFTATQPISVAPGTRNVVLRGCAYEGGSATSSTTGGTVWNWQGSGTAIIVGDPADGSDTGGFSLTDMAITTPSAGASADALDLHRVQEADIERVYLIGNATLGQTGILLDGKGNYAGGQFIGIHIASFGTALSLTGNSSGGANASTFVRLHIDCPTSAGAPIAGTIGINLAYGDGNTFTGGDVEDCATMLALGAGATNNTFTGLRNENSTTQISAAAGSAYNLWVGGGTLFTGALVDAGTHNSFQDAFHRGVNNLNGDIWRSQADSTVINHIYTGIGLGNVRGRQEEWTTDVPGTPGSYRNAWRWGPTDVTGNVQVWELVDQLNSVTRFGLDQLTTAGGNDETDINAAGSGKVCFGCSIHSGTGGVAFASGGATPTTVGSIDSSGNESLLGSLKFFNLTTLAYQWECSSGTSCTLYNSNATTPGRVFVSYPNGGTDIDSQGTAALTVNNTSTGGTGGFIVYEGGANSGTAAYTVTGTGATSQLGNSQIGSASGTGTLTLGNHLNQLAANDYAGACTVSTSTTAVTDCAIALQHSYTSAPSCTASLYGATPPLYPPNYTVNYASGDVYVYVALTAASESLTFSIMCVGNPN